MARSTLLAAIALGLFASASFADLIALYDFNGNALDSSGLGNNAGIVGSPAFVASDTSQALRFNNPFGQQAATQFVRLPNSGSILGLSNASFTFAIRYQSTDASLQNGRLFGNGGGPPLESCMMPEVVSLILRVLSTARRARSHRTPRVPPTRTL